ncbi:hypothetical protein [Flavobacterium wongokense]|uniref:hypothetical protein n=1 Tax=Flavobacterium wongokense TaxID=2910674 RepID=UPI001F348491|nr:hypothetical protein [Flavobacterium sp. WG47]MCF6131391.1 hypothetical protein [Flavobacterium sp. WG47]
MAKSIAFLLLISITMYSQQCKINIERYQVKDKLLYGMIDDRYAITMYLKYAASSGDHVSVYSVKGWYQYDNVKTHIPIVGIYDFSNGLTLYSLKDKSLEKKIADFDIPGDFVWGKIEYMRELQDFDEKFTISNEESNNKWTNKKRELKLKMSNIQDLSFENSYGFLKLDNKTYINLDDYSINYSHLEVINCIKTKTETKILLKYEEGGNPNVQGMCGAAEDFGYIILSFDSTNSLNYKEEEEVEFCRGNIYSEEIESNDKNVLKFKITDSSGEKEVNRNLTVDTKSIAFIKEK